MIRGPFRLILTDRTEHNSGKIDGNGHSKAPVRLASTAEGVTLWWATGWADPEHDTVKTHSRTYPWHRVSEIRRDDGPEILT